MLDISTTLKDIMQQQDVDSNSALLILVGGKNNEQSISVHESVSDAANAKHCE